MGSKGALRVFNSLTRQKEEFKPLTEDIVRMYVCGPTVYDLSHIGHARSAVTFDVIYRYLLYRGYDVRYARNYTDVDDKIIKRANDEGLSCEEIADRYIQAYDEDMDALGVKLPTYRPRATEAISDIIRLVETLQSKGFAYLVESSSGSGERAYDVYYRVRRFEGYGKLSGKNIEELESGARIEVDVRKEDPLDFALWKASRPGEPAWDSPWGRGRPGWHIECSAMSQSILGETIDIHGGGKDLIFPHHENEIAQSEAATGKPFVRYWLHNGFVNIDKEKMSKSLGNILTIKDVLKTHSAEAVRLFLISSHYRSPIDYSAEALHEAESALERYYLTIDRMEREWGGLSEAGADQREVEAGLAPFIEAMEDDFNTARVVGLVFESVNRANRLMDIAKRDGADSAFKKTLPVIRDVISEVACFLHVFNRTPVEYFEEKKGRMGMEEEEVMRLIKEREDARKRKDWKRADEIRDELSKSGIILEDTPEGTVWRVRGSY